MLTAEIIILITFALFMGWAGRMDGGAEPKTPEWFERTLVMTPIIALAAVVNPLFALPAYGGVIGIITGHGQYFLARAIKAIKAEKIDIVIRLFFGSDPRSAEKFRHLRGINTKDLAEADAKAIKDAMESYGMEKLYWRNIAGLTLGGSIVTIPLSIILAWAGGILAAIMALIAGAQKSLSYAIGYSIERGGSPDWLPAGLRKDTEIAEFLNRFIMTILLYLGYKSLTL